MIWGYVGPLIGVCLGACLGWRIQQSHWKADSRKREFQELLTALLRGYNAACYTYAPGSAHWAPELLRGFADDMRAADIALEDRVFIGGEVKRLDLQNRWKKAVGQFRSTHNQQTFEREFDRIKQDITKVVQR